MGVHGLWKLIEPSGKPVPLESLENKVLAVDLSIWLHQAIKGFQDSKGASIPNAHLLGIYHRLCKLLYYRIKPVFVFDGGVPSLKHETINKRNQLKSKNLSEANNVQQKLLKVLMKNAAIGAVLNENNAPFKGQNSKPQSHQDSLFVLPETQLSQDDVEDSEIASDESPTKSWNIHNIDEKSKQFRSLPADIRHEILTDLKETRKQSSWGRLHELPTQSDDFATFQMKRLLKRSSIQSSIEEAEKEMGGATLSIAQLEDLMHEQGVNVENWANVGDRISSNENTRFLYIKDVKKALEKARLKQEQLKDEEPSSTPSIKSSQIIDKELEDDLNTAIALSLQDVPSTSKNEKLNDVNNGSTTRNNKSFDNLELQKAIALSLGEEIDNRIENLPANNKMYKDNQELLSLSQEKIHSYLETLNDSDFQSSDEESVNEEAKGIFSVARNYMMEYGGLTEAGIDDILRRKKAQKSNFGKLENLVGEFQEKVSTPTEFTSDDSLKGSIDKLCDKKDKSMELGKENDEFIDNCKDLINYSYDKTEINVEVAKKLSNLLKTPSDTRKHQINVSFSDSSDDFLEVINEINKDIATKKQKTAKVSHESQKNRIKYFFSDGSEDLIEVAQLNRTKTDKQTAKTDPKLAKTSNEIEKESENDSLSENSDEFVEVTDEPQSKPNKPNQDGEKVMEILIDTEAAIETDDLFSDIFARSPEPHKKSPKPQKSIKNLIIANKQEEKQSIKQLKSDETKAPNGGKQMFEQKISTTDLRALNEILNQQTSELVSERASKERMAVNISDQMYKDVQELLLLFGIPYVLAPMEAEAQCAFLEQIELTHGTITDDSDIWLFGGKTVYKNFFNHDKQVLEYRSDSISKYFNLSRYELIALAMLVGSDYTVGVSGIGPVTALEVLAAFPTKPLDTPNPHSLYEELLSGLREFRKWIKDGMAPGPQKTSLKAKLKNVQVHEGFPNVAIARAYLDPVLETDEAGFSWGYPNRDVLIEYAREKFGWTEKKASDLLDPVFKQLKDKRKQTKIDEYFKRTCSLESSSSTTLIQERMSKRVKIAVGRLARKNASSEDDELQEEFKVLAATKKISKRKVKEIENHVKKIIEKPRRKRKLNADEEKAIDGEVKKKKDILVGNMLHLKDSQVIPQRQKDKEQMLKSRMKAVEVFRKSKSGPGYVKHKGQLLRKPKDDANLSESSSD